MPSKTKNLNILQFICPTGFYGAERWILALVKHLDAEQIRCDLAITREANSEDLEIVRRFRLEHQQIGKAFEIPMMHRFDIRAINRLVTIIKQREISIIHTHGYKSDIIGVIAARKAGIKCIVTPHGFENARDFKLRLFIWLGCKAMKFADSTVPLSGEIVNFVRKIGIDESRIHYIQNGVDLSEVESVYHDVSIPGPSQSRKRIGFIGQMISRKNIGDILDIFNELNSRHDSIELLLIGDGELWETLVAHANRLMSHKNIQFLGYRDNRLEYLKSFDLFVMTSTLEGIPRCMMEAMAMGVPVATYDIPGIDQLIEHNVTGLCAPFGNKQTLGRQWEDLLFDTHLSKRISANARKVVQENFSAQRMAREYTEHYIQILD